jgi:hypothetical protein
LANFLITIYLDFTIFHGCLFFFYFASRYLWHDKYLEKSATTFVINYIHSMAFLIRQLLSPTDNMVSSKAFNCNIKISIKQVTFVHLSWFWTPHTYLLLVSEHVTTF